MSKSENAEQAYMTQTSFDRLIVLIGNYLSLLFLLGVVISITEVVLRYIFNSPTIWAHETTILFCALCFVYGGSYCLALDKHIRINVVYDLLGAGTKKIIDLVSHLLCMIYLLAMSYAAWFVAGSSLFSPDGRWQPETSGSAWDPAFPAIVRSVLFLILVLMFIQVLLQFFKLLVEKPRA